MMHMTVRAVVRSPVPPVQTCNAYELLDQQVGHPFLFHLYLQSNSSIIIEP